MNRSKNTTNHELSNQLEDYKSIFNSLQVGILIINAKNHTIVAANPSAVEIIGESKDKIIGHSCHKYICPQKEGKCPVTDLNEIIHKKECTIINTKGQNIPVIKTVATVTLDNEQYLIESFIDIIKQKKMETDLREVKEQLEATITALPDLLFEIDYTGRIYNYHTPNPELLYVKPEEFIGKTFMDVLPEDAGRIIMDAMRKTISSDRYCEAIYSLNMPDGIHWFELFISKKKNTKISKNRLIILVKDITRRKHAEIELKESEERFRAIFETANDFIFIKNYNMKYIKVNPAVEKLFNMPESEILGLTDDDLFGKNAGKHIREIDTRVLNGETIQEEDTKPVGNIDITFHIIKVPLYDNSGKITGLCGIARDISTRKQEELKKEMACRILELLNHSRKETDVISDILTEIKKFTKIEAVGIRLKKGDDYPYYKTEGFSQDFIRQGDSLCVLDEEGKIKHDSNETIKLGCICGIIINGNTDSSLPFFTENGSFWTNNGSKLLTNSQFSVKNFKGYCITEGYESIAIIPLRSNNDVVGILHLSDKRKDMFNSKTITFFEELGESIGIALERKKIEQELIESNTKLNETLNTLEKAQKQLIKSERLSALGQMSSGIAHDFNNVLMPIVGLIDFLLSNKKVLDNKDELISTLEDIKLAAQDARKIVKTLSQWNKQGSQDISFSSVNLNNIINQTVKLLQPRTQSNKNALIKVELRLNNIPSINGNETELREAITNMILNSLDSMPDGGTLTITSRSNDNHVTVTISDTGQGMSQETQHHAMEPFYTTKGSKGTGMGLAMVHGIVQQHNGFIDIESQINKGTTFLIRFPIQTIPTAKKTKDSKSSKHQLPALNILIIDDELRTRKTIEYYLKAGGHNVKTADSGEQGLKIFKKEKIDLVITDCSMPDIKGEYVAKMIKEINPSTPIIMLTGFGDIMNSNGNIPNSVDTIVNKPITEKELRNTIKKLLGKTAQ